MPTAPPPYPAEVRERLAVERDLVPISASADGQYQPLAIEQTNHRA
jgi:hypothetical protein